MGAAWRASRGEGFWALGEDWSRASAPPRVRGCVEDRKVTRVFCEGRTAGGRGWSSVSTKRLYWTPNIQGTCG